MKMILTAAMLTLAMAGSALAADTEWAFYGVAHVSLNSLSDGTSRQVGLTSNTSRFGLRGTSPINDDFTAFWQVESDLDMAGNTPVTTIGTRNTFVGLGNETAGKFLVGRHDTPFKSLGRQVEMFPDQLGDFRALTMGWDDRQSELAAWISPDWDGFSVMAAYQFDMNSPGDTEHKTAFSAMGSFANERWLFGAAYQGFASGYNSDGGFDDEGDGPTAKRIVGKYMATQFEVAGLYQTMTAEFYDDDDFVDRNQSVMGLAGTYHATEEWSLKGAWYVYNYNTDAFDLEPVPGDFDYTDTRATMLVLGVERVFSENVLVYAQAAAMNNHDALLFRGEPVPLAGYDSGFGRETFGSSDNGWQDPAGFSIGTVINW